MLGTPSGGSSAYSLLGVYKYAYYAPWVQDDWRITPRLTVNLGLRWDFNMPPTNRRPSPASNALSAVPRSWKNAM